MNIFKRFLMRHIKGQNNYVIRERHNKKRKLIFSPKNLKIIVFGNGNKIVIHGHLKISNSKIKIDGNNNFIVLYGNKLEDSNITISGDNNKIKLGKNVKYIDTLVSESGNRNYFSIGQTNNSVKQAIFFVEDGATVRIGKNSELKNRGLHVVVNNGYKNKPKLIMGDNVHIAKDCIIRASDGHSIIDEFGNAINEPKDIIIGNNVWIMSRCTILKGTKLMDGTAVGANSLVNKMFQEENILLVGTPARILRKNFKWDCRPYNRYMEAKFD